MRAEHHLMRYARVSNGDGLAALPTRLLAAWLGAAK